MKKHNFSAGPAILPAEVIKEASEAAAELNGSGLSIMEISHRSKAFVDILNEAVQLVQDILGLDDSYAVLFLTGGASSQFFMVPMNLLAADQSACYLDTGSWSTKAIKEAKNFGNVEVLASSKSSNFNYIPKDYTVPADAAYLHFTSNNTIFGTQYQQFPDTSIPLVCDMSSDIFSRPIDVNRFGVIYAGAQKNLGPAGTTLVIVKKDLLGKAGRTIPTMLNYETHIKKNSAFNTPPVYPIFVCMLTLRWIKGLGGLEVMYARNKEKAGMFYDELDRNQLFEGVAAKEDRSLMNPTFVLKNADLEEAFLDACTQTGCVGVKGHRSVGGFRASMYNALPKESVAVLIEVMKDFEKKYA